MDKKRRAGRPGEFLDSLSVGGLCCRDEWYARTGGLRVVGARRGPYVGRGLNGTRRNPM